MGLSRFIGGSDDRNDIPRARLMLEFSSGLNKSLTCSYQATDKCAVVAQLLYSFPALYKFWIMR